MKHIAWLTDIHLNFIDFDCMKSYCHSINEQSPHAVLIGGDIGESQSVGTYLWFIEKELKCPIFFVLGNHDYYRSSIANVRKEMEELHNQSKHLFWLSKIGILKLTDNTCLVGHGSWNDGRFGNYENSNVELSDYGLIGEFSAFNKDKRLIKLHQLGDEAALRFRQLLPKALDKFNHVLILTHVPPFKESCWHEGRISDDNFLPHFSCKAVGDVLLEYMKKNPDKNMTVLCGHTHSSGQVKILPNLLVKTGGAEYKKPEIQEILIVK